MGFERIEELEAAIQGCGLQLVQLLKEALFLAGKVFLKYRKCKGSKTAPLPDFFVGAHATVAGLKLITKDVPRYMTYFPTVEVIKPNGS